jgi:Ca2+-binding EF-hand superfamily protein
MPYCKKAASAAALFAVLIFAGESRAQAPAQPQQPQQEQEQPVNAFLLGRLQGGATLERYLEALRSEFTRADADNNGKIDAADIETHAAMMAASLRLMHAMQIMGADLNGDGVVTADELRRKFRYDRRNFASQNRPGAPSVDEQVEQQVERLMKADLDKDGKITWLEAIEYAKSQPGYARTLETGIGASAHQILELAPGKPAVTRAEMEAAATAFFRSIDTDHNGTISLDELDVVRKRQQRVTQRDAQLRMQQSVRVACDMPKASESAKVMLLGAYETQSLSSVALGSQDEVTGVGNIVVERGDDPLYIVIATYRPTIWRFYGATERVERVVVMASRTFNDKAAHKQVPLAGVVGLPAERVSFPQRVNCLHYFYTVPSLGSAQAGGALQAALGKAPALIAGKYAVVSFNVPSGKIETVGAAATSGVQIQQNGSTFVVELDGKSVRLVKREGGLERDLERFSPGGVVTIDAKQVVASAKAEPYEVLPEQAGLIQLVKSGALTRNERDEFLINKKIRFPAGLAGAHSVKFLLLRGVPKPDGNPGHSTVISEETGETLKFD